MRKFYITASGVDNLRLELARLMAQRKQAAERVQAAREFGDLSENSEYTVARQELITLEASITSLEHVLRNTTLISEPASAEVVVLGSTVSLEHSSGNRTFQIVGTIEADPLLGKISDESPIGQMLLGKKKGDEIAIGPTNNAIRYVIVAIT